MQQRVGLPSDVINLIFLQILYLFLTVKYSL